MVEIVSVYISLDFFVIAFIRSNSRIVQDLPPSDIIKPGELGLAASFLQVSYLTIIPVSFASFSRAIRR